MTTNASIAPAPPTRGRPETRAWYREPYVWLIIGIPGSAVLMGAIMLTLAIDSDDGLVADDYYKRGLEINRSIERDVEAARLALHATVDLDPESATAGATLAGNAEFVPPERIALRLLHATRAGADLAVDLVRLPDGRYAGNLPSLAPRATTSWDEGASATGAGRWHVQLETDTWRLSARLQGVAEGRVDLEAAPPSR